MNALRDLDQEEVLAAAEVALATSTGETVHIQDAQVLSDERRRNLILRGNAVGPGGQSRPIIIKITRLSSYDPGAENALDNSGLLKEWAATAFLSTQRPARRHSAMLLAGDAVRGLLVFEDLGAGLGSLVEPLLHGSADEAERALLAYASALGRLHVDTAGHIVEYERTLRAVLPAIRRTVPRPRAKIEENASKVRERLGGPPAPDGLMQIAQRLDSRESGLASCMAIPVPTMRSCRRVTSASLITSLPSPGTFFSTPHIGDLVSGPAGARDEFRMRSPRRPTRPIELSSAPALVLP